MHARAHAHAHTCTHALACARTPEALLRCDRLAAQAIEHGLAEEAFEIYKKFDKKVEAILVLLEHVPEDGLQRAFDYATKVRAVQGAAARGTGVGALCMHVRGSSQGRERERER